MWIIISGHPYQWWFQSFGKPGSSHKGEELIGEFFPCKIRKYHEAVRKVKVNDFHSNAPFFRPLPILWFVIGSSP